MLSRLKRRHGETIELELEGLGLPLLLRRSGRARRLSLQVSEARRGAVLTLPLYSSLAEADAFLSRHLAWLRERAAALSEPVPFAEGAIVPLRGHPHRLHFAGAARARGVVWVEEPDATSLPRLAVSGSVQHAPRRLLDWFKRQAQLDLRVRVGVHAERLGLRPSRVSVRDQSTRWGSCSTSGALSFSWRLVLAPAHVLDYLAAH
jgi:predicted metal-dependent hydrolase